MVAIDNSFKEAKKLKLGPLLFTIYINDLADNVSQYIEMYADDTKLISLNDSTALQADIYHLQNWAIT